MKKFSLLLLVLMMSFALVLAGCGSDPAPADDTVIEDISDQVLNEDDNAGNADNADNAGNADNADSADDTAQPETDNTADDENADDDGDDTVTAE